MKYLINPIQKLEVEDENLQLAAYIDICYNQPFGPPTQESMPVHFNAH